MGPPKLMTTFTFTRFFQKSPNIKKSFVIATRVTTTTWIHYCLIQLTLSKPENFMKSLSHEQLPPAPKTSRRSPDKTIGDWIRKLLKAWLKHLITKLLEGANCKMICSVLGSIMSDWRFKKYRLRDVNHLLHYYYSLCNKGNASQPTWLCKHFIS